MPTPDYLKRVRHMTLKVHKKLLLTGAAGGLGQALRERLKGKLLLRVQAGGQISYVDLNGYRHDIRMDNLMDIFRSLSLGISNNDIRKIAIGETE